MAFCNPCLRPADSSVLKYVKHSSKSMKTILHRQIFKKSSLSIQKQGSTHRFQRIKGSNFIQEIVPNNKTIDLINNYDMTIFHDDELDNTQIALTHRRSKKIPHWAQKSQLELAIINQIYYNDKKPEDIFGTIQFDLLYQMINSIELLNTELPVCFNSYSKFPSNFV